MLSKTKQWELGKTCEECLDFMILVKNTVETNFATCERNKIFKRQSTLLRLKKLEFGDSLKVLIAKELLKFFRKYFHWPL